jgi:hypothetical protein
MQAMQQRLRLVRDAERRATRVGWAGLAAMGVQTGVFARLTWWEYSWDIMEPVTYFATYSSVIACFAYYMVTKQVRRASSVPIKTPILQSFEYPAVHNRLYLQFFHRRARTNQFDWHTYNDLKQRALTVEHDLRRMRYARSHTQTYYVQ